MAKDPACGMEVDVSSAFKLTRGSETFYFCSEQCLRSFARPRKWYHNKTLIVTGVLLFLVILSYSVFSFLAAFRNALFIYFKKISGPILLGLLFSGLMERFVPREYISSLMAPPKKRTILYAVGLGFLSTACSCGVLALSIQLYKKGASTPAVVAFLLASPWASMPLTFLLIGFFGWIKAFYIIGSAIVIAFITGWIFQVLERRDLVEHNDNTLAVDKDFSIPRDIQERYIRYQFSMKTILEDIRGVLKGAWALGDTILWWILIGIALASFAGAYVPTEIFRQYMGPTALGLTVTLVAATLMEVCSEGSSPFAFEIFRQTGALGNSFVFLMGGVVTDYTEIGVLWHNVGKKTAMLLPLITIPQVIILGVLGNQIF